MSFIGMPSPLLGGFSNSYQSQQDYYWERHQQRQEEAKKLQEQDMITAASQARAVQGQYIYVGYDNKTGEMTVSTRNETTQPALNKVLLLTKRRTK